MKNDIYIDIHEAQRAFESGLIKYQSPINVKLIKKSFKLQWVE